MGSGSFGARLGAFMAVAVFIAALSAVVLWTREEARRLDEAVTSQVGFVLSEAKASLEVQLNLGLALGDLPQVEGLLARASASLPGIRSVAVLDENGAVLFSTNTVEVGETLPVGQAEAAGGAAGRVSGLWSDEQGEERIYGVGLATSFDTAAGSVLVRMPAGAMAEPIRHYALTLALGGVLAAVVAGLLGWLAGLWLARGPRRALAGLAAVLEGLDERAHAAEPATLSAAAGPAGTLGLPAADFVEAVRSRLSILDRAEREVARLDELA
ncbi:hypothetical protein [Azospirillum picis]|uniref:HAMP domain-containing protein n=1 Tax=Azospirillum picis TaxID=488438 RepID=A0ABU0MFL8_9PROT|nr:hypothetical protein [Azospirillum picis]MBP2298710.1 hypothetical protein [Azospirillum picis]MDQ0532241.1 hypothetical protein [Azospirillum picis]